MRARFHPRIRYWRCRMSNLSKQVTEPLLKNTTLQPKPIPVGLCQCGCGQATSISKRNAEGYSKGEPKRFASNHHPTTSTVLYTEEDRGYTTKCWIWRRSFNKDTGYGNVSKTLGGTAHRFMYERFNSKVPEGMTLDHLCRVRLCVNPEHLEVVTNAENSRRGEKTTKLNWEKVSAMREMRSQGATFTAIGKAFNVDRKYAHMVCVGERWSSP